MNRYETVFILTPALTDDQAKEAVKKFRKILNNSGACIIHEESWGVKTPRLQAHIDAEKKTGYYQLFEFDANSVAVADLEIAYKRDERVLRFMTIKIDKG